MSYLVDLIERFGILAVFLNVYIEQLGAGGREMVRGKA